MVNDIVKESREDRFSLKYDSYGKEENTDGVSSSVKCFCCPDLMMLCMTKTCMIHIID